MTLAVDPYPLTRAGRAAEQVAARLREAGAVLHFGATEVDDDGALDCLKRRVHHVAHRIGSNGRSLQVLVREAEAVDIEVGAAFLVLAGNGWR